MPVTIGTEKFSHFGECHKLTNGTVEVFITSEMGPRVIAYRFVGGTNIFAEMSLDVKVSHRYGDWRPMGGHRLWHAPEVLPRSYMPDNDPVEPEVIDDDTVRVIPPAETGVGIQKAMTVTLDSEGTGVTVIHEISNIGVWPIEVAPWALSIMNGGGTVIIPQEEFVSHDDYLLPARPLVLWHFTDLTDSRLRLGKKYIRLSTDSGKDSPNKIGVGNTREWAAYFRQGTLFVKHFPSCDCCEFPDMGCNCETYTEGNFIELESLGALTTLEPGETSEHYEVWRLFRNVDIGDTEDSLDAAITPLIEETE